MEINTQEVYEFNPSVKFDEATQQYEVIFKEIHAGGSGASREEAIEIAIDNIIDLTDDFFENRELYMGMEQYKEQFPYFSLIRQCENKEELKKVLNLDIHML